MLCKSEEKTVGKECRSRGVEERGRSQEESGEQERCQSAVREEDGGQMGGG